MTVMLVHQITSPTPEAELLLPVPIQPASDRPYIILANYCIVYRSFFGIKRFEYMHNPFHGYVICNEKVARKYVAA